MLPLEEDKLLDYFVTTVAPPRVWLDSDANEYKKLEPLAKKQPVLHLSIQAAAAAHMQADPQSTDALCQRAVRMISETIKPMVDANRSPTRPAHQEEEQCEALLASMLILSVYALRVSNWSEARVHREAARTLVNTMALSRQESRRESFFYQNQLAIYDILACTTIADPTHVCAAVEPVLGTGEIFDQYLTLINRLTKLSVQQSEAQPAMETPSFESFEAAFEMAMGSTLLSASRLLDGQSAVSSTDFVRLTRVYHHAGLLYAQDCLEASTSGPSRSLRAERIYAIFHTFEHLEANIHNLAWPAFIAGTAAAGVPAWQATTTQIFQTMYRATRSKHYLDTLAFLQELWGQRASGWFDLARQWEMEGRPIVAI